MSWHEDLPLEIAVEFQRLTMPAMPYEDLLWFFAHAKRLAWSAHGAEFRQSGLGRAKSREYMRERYRLLKATPDGWAKCKACRRQFEVSVMDRRKGVRVCSHSCAAALRHTKRGGSSQVAPASSPERRKARLEHERGLRATPDGLATCQACNRPFEVNALQRRKRRTKVCSHACAGLLRHRKAARP